MLRFSTFKLGGFLKLQVKITTYSCAPSGTSKKKGRTPALRSLTVGGIKSSSKKSGELKIAG